MLVGVDGAELTAFDIEKVNWREKKDMPPLNKDIFHFWLKLACDLASYEVQVKLLCKTNLLYPSFSFSRPSVFNTLFQISN